MDRLDEQVFLAIGRAMACADEEKAYEIGKQLTVAIREYIQEKTQPQPPTYVPYPVYPYNPLFPYQWICGSEPIKVTLDTHTVCNPTICNPKGY